MYANPMTLATPKNNHPQISYHSAWQTGFSFATCGELIQGIVNDEYFLVNCPINYSSHVQVRPNITSEITVITPGDYQRLVSALELYLKHINQPNMGLDVTIYSHVPRSKGMASSTSELTAALCACAKALQETVTADLISHILTRIEPSDGTCYPGIVRYNQLTGHVYEYLGEPPSLCCLIVDTGGQLDTQQYDRQRAQAIHRHYEPQIQQALRLLRQGFSQQSAALIAKAATISAQCNQQIRYQAMFEPLLAEAQSLGALGVNCAHTGTILGILYDPNQTHQDTLQHRISSAMGPQNVLGSYTIIPGGLL